VKGVWGKILLVDLRGSEARVKSEMLGEDAYRLLLGGRGLAVYLLYRYAGRGVDPLSPDNPLIIAPGLLLGSGIPTASKTAFAAKSPLTGLLGRAASGAWLGYALRKSGFDALVVRGALDEPGVLLVDGGEAWVDEAGNLWGLMVGEARRRLRDKYGRGFMDAVIGPAGENLSRMAMIDCNGRQAGRTGLGAVMGSKKLKAMLVRGSRSPEYADPEGLRRLAAEWGRRLLSHPSTKSLMEYGTPAIIHYTNKVHGVFPSLNWRESTLDWCPDLEEAHRSLGYWAPSLRVGRNPCPYCNRVCSQVVEVEYKGRRLRTDGPEYETVYSLGSNLGFCRVEPVAVLNYYADEYGLDSISLGGVLGWAIEAFEKGLLTNEDTGGLELRWGDLDSLVEAARRIAYREGRLGELLADGVAEAARRLGGGEEFAVHVKGLSPPAYDARGLKGMALSYAVASRGADHLTSGAYAVELPGTLWVYEGVDPRSSEGKGVLVKHMEDLMAYFDATGICKFSRYMMTPETMEDAVEAVTGVRMSGGELMLAGERTVNIERIYNLREGLEPLRDDTLPRRITEEPIRRGPSKGSLVGREELRAMLREYYAARGWGPDGTPTAAKIMELSLNNLLGEEALKYSRRDV